MASESKKHSAKDFHERAAKSSYDARGRAITLSTATLGGLFALITSDSFLEAYPFERILVTGAGIFLGLSIAFGVFNSYADAQWSYYRACYVAAKQRRASVDKSNERRWHKHKKWSEKGTQILFALGMIFVAMLMSLIAWRY